MAYGLQIIPAPACLAAPQPPRAGCCLLFPLLFLKQPLVAEHPRPSVSWRAAGAAQWALPRPGVFCGARVCGLFPRPSSTPGPLPLHAPHWTPTPSCHPAAVLCAPMPSHKATPFPSGAHVGLPWHSHPALPSRGLGHCLQYLSDPITLLALAGRLCKVPSYPSSAMPKPCTVVMLTLCQALC